MVVLTLPLSFTNSFWTPDYRKGLEVLFAKLEQGVIENDEIVAFIRARAVAETQLAISLTSPVPVGQRGIGFSTDDGASLLMAFRGLQAESVAQGEAHKSIAKELHTLVADPFQDWAQGYRERLKQNKTAVIENWLRSYELAQAEVAKLKNQYLTKNRRADEAEDDAKFAPNHELGDKYTSSPRLAPHDRTPPQRTPSVSERIAQRLKEIQRKSTTQEPPKADETVFEAGSESEKSPPLAAAAAAAPKVDKGKGKAVEEPESALVSSPPPMSPALPPAQLTEEPTAAPPPILLAGLSMQPSAVSALLKRAAAELELRPIRVPLLGEYQDCFNGEDFVAWLNVNVQGFGGNLDTAEDAARELTERYNLLRRIGELGNSFEHSDDAFYQFRPKAFDLEGKASETAGAPSPTKNLAPLASNFMKRSNTFVNVVAKALNANGQSEPAHIKARHDAEEADKAYRVAIRRLDRQRLGVEEKIEETLKTLQRWEAERLRAVKIVLLQYQGTLANIPKALEGTNERSKTLIASYQPESDLKALIERYRTGPFHPTPQVYESVAHDESDVVFGIDLRKWSEGGWEALTTGEQKKELYPNVLSALLGGLKDAYGRLPDDGEKRKAWIYEVPLSAVHHLRETLNAVDPELPIPPDLLAKYDAPVIASAIKLWLLELDPPLALWDGWDEIRKLYPIVGSKANANPDAEVSEQQHIQELSATLQKLPRVHLYVLDALVSHFKDLIDTTSVEEDNEVFLTKLALSAGRTIVRPKSETEITLNDRHPTLLFIDLVKNYAAIIPPTIAKKKRESERKIPLRKRTAPVDMRMVRGKISAGAPTREIYAAQQAAQNADVVPPLPPLPPNVSATVSAPQAVAAEPQPAATPPPPPKLEAPKVVSTPLVPPPPPPSSIPAPPSVPPPPLIPAPSPIPPPPAVNLSELPRPQFKEPPPEDDDDLPPRPSFKEPPPEDDDDLPPRPSFKEPPPEDDDAPEDDTPPPRPNFVDPPVSPPATPPPPPPPATEVIPPTPQSKPSPVPVKRNSLITLSNSPSSSSAKRFSRSPSPPINPDKPLNSAGASISRSGSGQAGYVRAPRISGGPRTSVSSIVSNLNRHSMSGPPSSSSSPPSYKRLSGSPSRPVVTQDSRVRSIGRTQALSRRTMASDAEDEVVQ